MASQPLQVFRSATTPRPRSPRPGVPSGFEALTSRVLTGRLATLAGGLAWLAIRARYGSGSQEFWIKGDQASWRLGTHAAATMQCTTTPAQSQR